MACSCDGVKRVSPDAFDPEALSITVDPDDAPSLPNIENDPSVGGLSPISVFPNLEAPASNPDASAPNPEAGVPPACELYCSIKLKNWLGFSSIIYSKCIVRKTLCLIGVKLLRVVGFLALQFLLIVVTAVDHSSVD